ncbi:MAG: hypothetical protein KDE15_13730 [Erythrobacter sp.]|nr:hypothetical protein [Erythrobacter sp.]
MRTTIARTVIAAAALLGGATHALATEMLLEERLARAEEARIIASPIAGIQNHLWFDYLGDVVEAQEELVSDLNRASDLEDLRDAWEEYTHELRHEREHYVDEMAERGYRSFTITVD